MNSNNHLIIDCSVHEPLNENIAKLNEYLQKNKLPALEITSEKQGSDHQPTFICQTKWEDRIYKASASTKKEAEKKLRSYLWALSFSKESISKHKVTSPLPEKSLPNNKITSLYNGDIPKMKIADYENFKVSLRQSDPNPKLQNPTLFIDLSTIDQGSFLNKEAEEYCFHNFSRTVIFGSENKLEWGNSVVILTKETNQTMLSEYINRIIYFLLDQNGEQQIILLALRQFPSLISSAAKTGQKVSVFPDFQHLKLRNQN